MDIYIYVGELVLPVNTAARSRETLKESSHVHDGLDHLECYGAAQGPKTGNVVLFCNCNCNCNCIVFHSDILNIHVYEMISYVLQNKNK